MDELGTEFRAWLRRQKVLRTPVEQLDENRFLLAPGPITAQITFLPLPEQFVYRTALDEDAIIPHEAVELRMGRMSTVDPSFYARFVLDDLYHARQLFREMCKALEAETFRGAARVLVCSDSEEERPALDALLANLRRVADTLSIAYEFELATPEQAMEAAEDYSGVLLSPHARGYQKRIHHLHPFAVVFPIPQTAFEQANGKLTLQLLLEALGEIDTLSCSDPHVRPLWPLPREGTILIINVMYCDRCVRVGHRVYRNADLLFKGAVTKAKLSLRDIEDIIDTLALDGIFVQDLDAIGFVTPGVVNYCSMNLPSLGDRDNNLACTISRQYGLPVFMDNNTNAAAMGCYLLQKDYQSITLYRHQLGHKNGGQGTVIDGKVITGRYNLAGEPKFYQQRFLYNDGYVASVWNDKGLTEVTRNVLLATIGTVSPDAVYLAVSTIEDTWPISQALERALPKYCIPELHTVSDYRERMYLGEMYFCLQRLAEGVDPQDCDLCC